MTKVALPKKTTSYRMLASVLIAVLAISFGRITPTNRTWTISETLHSNVMSAAGSNERLAGNPYLKFGVANVALGNSMIVSLSHTEIIGIKAVTNAMPEFLFNKTVDSFNSYLSKAAHGTLTPITDDGYFITAYHVVKNADDLVYVTYDDSRCLTNTARLVWTSKHADLAIVHVPVTTVHHYEWTHSNASRNAPVIVVDKAGKTQTGRLAKRLFVRRLSRDTRPFREIFHTAKLLPGDSGGPLLNNSGELLGINVSTIGITTNNDGHNIISKSIRPNMDVIKNVIENDRNRAFVG
jgi:S1-C subfamily serine protease